MKRSALPFTVPVVPRGCRSVLELSIVIGSVAAVGVGVIQQV